MARSLQQIKSEIKTEIRTYPSLNSYKFPEEGGSSVSVFNLFITVTASAILVFEKIHDIFKEDIATLSAQSISGNSKWLQNQILLFQYGDIIQIDDSFSPYYPVEDASKRIITRCAIIDEPTVGIKVAKGTAPTLEPLTTAEMDALKDYYYGTQFNEGIGFAGIPADFISLYPDRMMVAATVYYSSQLRPDDVKNAVITAINDYFATFQDENFAGTVFMIKLTDAIQAVTGVTRVVYSSVLARAESTDYASATPVDFQGFYKTAAGYLISEDEPTHTLADSIIVTPETL